MRRGALLLVLALLGFGPVGGLSAQDKSSSPNTPSNKDAAPDKEAQRLLLETVGTLAGAHLYQSYLNIGFIADGKTEGTYQEKDIQQILGSVTALMESLDKKLDLVAKLDLSK